MHAKVLCEGKNGVGHRIMSCVREFAPRVAIESAWRLDFDVEDDMEFPSGKAVCHSVSRNMEAQS